MTQKFILSQFDQQIGPFDENELRAKWKGGELLPIDYVFDDSKQDWVLVAERFGWAIAPGTTHPPPLKPLKVSGTKVKLTDGIGEFDLSPLQPGVVHLALHNSSSMLLKLQEPLQIQVKPAEPVEVAWSFTADQTVGQDIEVKVKGLDALGFVATEFNDRVVLRIEGGEAPQEVPVQLKRGQASAVLHNIKAETWKLSLHYIGGKKLRLPEPRSLTWQPGPATRLILDGPQEYVAGHPLKVQVKAVDNFGNLAKTFQGTVTLEVKAG